MNFSHVSWLSYLMLILIRLAGLRYRFRIPQLLGPGTFFSLRVPPDFYSGPGRRLLRTYRLSLPVAYIIEALVLAPVFYWGHPGWIMFSVILTTLMIVISSKWVMRRIIRKAKPYALACDLVPSTVSLPMEPRRLGTYRSLPFELFVWTCDFCAVLFVAQSVGAQMSLYHLNVADLVGLLLRLFGLAPASSATGASYGAWLFWPLLLAYIQFGALLSKYAVISWPMRLSSDISEEVRVYREGVRRYLVRSCDWFRSVFALSLLVASFEIRHPEIAHRGWWRWFTLSLSLSLLAAILLWYNANIRKFFRIAKGLRQYRFGTKVSGPVDPARFRLGGLVYYDPDSPSVVIPSRVGYALNFADRRAYISLAYFGGLAILALIHLRFGWG